MLLTVSPPTLIEVTISHFQSTYSMVKTIPPLPLIRVTIWEIHCPISTVLAFVVVFALIEILSDLFIVSSVRTRPRVSSAT